MLPDGGASGLLGRTVSRQQRERRQTTIDSPAQGESLAPHDAGSSGLGGLPQEGLLPPSPLLPLGGSSRSQEGHSASPDGSSTDLKSSDSVSKQELPPLDRPRVRTFFSRAI